ncbi:MAG: sensor histidine kinase [Rhodoferax sp.]|nr:sensor histidine kinase [Rhodoferax sp.]
MLPFRERSRFGIRARLLTLLLPCLLALLVLDSWNDYRAQHDLMQDAYDQAMLEPVSALEHSIALAADGSIRVQAPFDVQAMFDVTRPQHKFLHVGLTALPDKPGQSAQPASEVTLIGVADLPPPPAGAGADNPFAWYDAHYQGYPVRMVALRRTVLDGHAQPYQVLIQAAEGTGPRVQAQADLLREELLQGARMVAVVLLLVWLGVSWSLRPLERLRKSVQASPPDDLMPLDARDVPHEVVPLVDAVNHHMARRQQMLAGQSRFLADASHQLRTPLAIMLTQAGYALREPDATRMRETLHAIVTQLTRSRRLCEQLLALAQASQVADKPSSPPVVDLNRVAREVVLQYLPLAREKNQDLGWIDARGEASASDDADAPAAPVAPVAARDMELHEALSNLVHNAIRYTPAGGRITVSVQIGGGQVCAEVSDSGPGIAPCRRDSVFERFAQAASADGSVHPAPGAGLGLSIARAYARRNGGDIELADGDAPAGGAPGLRARLRLPLAHDSSAQPA